MIATVERPASRWTLVALLLFGGVCVCGQGRWPIPLAAWLAPILLMRYARLSRAWLGLVGLMVVHSAAWEVAYLGMVPMPTAARWGLWGGLSLVFGGVFLADRWVARCSFSFWTTLVFPCGWAAYEYLNGRFSPSGSWGSIAYTFTEQHTVVQVASLVGWTGITFIVGWVASVTNWAWQRGLSDQRTWRGCVACGGAIAALLVYGGARLWMLPPGETVRVATIVGPSSFIDDGEFRRDVWAYTRGIELPDEAVVRARQHIEHTIEQHMALCENELRAGAQLVSFPEANPAITAAEEGAFVEAASRLATHYDAYIGLGLFVFRPEAGLPAQNKFILIGPDGAIVWDYLKSTRVPGSSHVVGEGVLPDVETRLGRLSCAICFDMDFPALLGQAGRNDTDVLLAPSNDWPEVRTTHARMAVMRAVEQGFTLVRPTKDGISIVTDPLGRTVAWQDTNPPGAHILIAEVPTSGVATIYSVIGDAFSWACIAGFISLFGYAVVQARQSAAVHAEALLA